MPWKEVSKMEERHRFINAVLEQSDTFKNICADFNISAKTGYKWLNRFKEDGYGGLFDYSRRPHSQPGQLEEGIVCDLIALKMAHIGWGPKKIQRLFSKMHPDEAPSISSINRIFKRTGLVKKRRVRHYPSGRLTSKVEIKQPNDLWTVDFKGWWMSADKRRIEPLTIRDAYSRYVLACEYLENTRTELVMAAFHKLFTECGLPRVVQSDNGSPFASKSNIKGISQLSAWLISLGITINRSRPGHPQDNGGHERMHRDLKESVQVRFRGNANQYQAELDLWREEFNELRPHESLDMKTPAEIYRKSERKYSGSPAEINYSTEYQIRKVADSGFIRYKGIQYFISSALRKHMVGIKVIDSAKLAVYFSEVFLGTIDLKTLSFLPVES